MRHRKRLFPGIPRPGLVAREPAPGNRRRDGIEFHRAAWRAPVAVQGFDGFHRDARLFRRGVWIRQSVLQVTFPALLRRLHKVRRAGEDIADLRLLMADVVGGQQMRISGPDRRRTLDVRGAGEAMPVNVSLNGNRLMHLILRCPGGQQIPGRTHFAKRHVHAVARGDQAALIVRIRAIDGFIGNRFALFGFQFFQQLAIPLQNERRVASDLCFQKRGARAGEAQGHDDLHARRGQGLD
ncbi:hypothetical protein D3C86_1413280 [compost metagenome]